MHPQLLAAVAKKLGVRRSGGGEGGEAASAAAPALPADAVRIVRKSFDARSATKTGAPAR